MQTKMIIAAAIGLPVAALGLKTLLRSSASMTAPMDIVDAVSKTEIPDVDEAEEKRREIMREMGAKGGRKSKRGKAKPKKEPVEDGVPA